MDHEAPFRYQSQQAKTVSAVSFWEARQKLDA
jgi:hypothetical protein